MLLELVLLVKLLLKHLLLALLLVHLLLARVLDEVLWRGGDDRHGPGGERYDPRDGGGRHAVRRPILIGGDGGDGCGLGLVGKLLDEPLVLADRVFLIGRGRDPAAAAAAPGAVLVAARV